MPELGRRPITVIRDMEIKKKVSTRFWKILIEEERQIFLRKEFQSLGATNYKDLSQVTSC